MQPERIVHDEGGPTWRCGLLTALNGIMKLRMLGQMGLNVWIDKHGTEASAWNCNVYDVFC